MTNVRSLLTAYNLELSRNYTHLLFEEIYSYVVKPFFIENMDFYDI